MARHSKWHNIKHRKAAQDAMKGKIYALHAKFIAMAAQSGGDPAKNPSLDMAIAKAKQDGVPADNIERAVKKGTGEDKTGIQINHIVYEGYAPGGVAVVVSVLTDNKNRTAADMRHIFSRHGGNMGEPGSVSWIFQKKGILIFDTAVVGVNRLEELVFDTDAEDMELDEGELKVITSVDSFDIVTQFFQGCGITPVYSATEYVASNEVVITEFEKALKITKMLEALEEDEDVEDYALNYSISDELQKEVDDFIEKNTFRT